MTGRIVTLGYLIDRERGRILLGRKKFGGAAGKLNGFGGKLEETDENIRAAMLREFEEETHARLLDPKLNAIVYFTYAPATEPDIVLYCYTASQWDGHPEETNEMTVEWYDLAQVPIADMWPGDQLWFQIAIGRRPSMISLQFIPGQDDPVRLEIDFEEPLRETHNPTL